MIELFGNSIWNNNTPNTDKKVIIADEKELKKIEQSINNAGFNYCAYIRKGNAYIAVNKNDVENIHKLNINIKAVSNSNNKPYKPNKIIGNTPFKNINNKYYQKYSADIAYAVAYRLDELNIPFSGKLYDVYNSVTITIDKAYVEQIQSIAKEITEQRSLITNSNGKITNAIKDAVKKLNYSEEQLKSINKAENLLLDRIDDENLLSAFDAMFEGTNKYSADDIAKLSDEFVKIFENLHGLECVFASRNDFNGLKKEFDKNILFEKYTQDKGFSSEQEKVIKNMIDKNMDSVLDILDFTFSVSEMEDMYLAYQQGDYDRLINIVASVKDTSRIEIEGEIESGTYTPVLPNYDTLDRDLFFNNPDSESVTHIYYNPDANSGGQFVISEINYYEIENALKKFSDKSDDVETFFDYLDSISEQKCIDIGDDLFLETYQKFYSNEHIAEGITDEVKKQLTNIATVNYTVPDKTDYYKSYFEIQSEHPDAIILFRVGDFYEVLGDNAQEAAEALNLTLMSRTINGEKIPMVGFPSSYLENNENLLVENGHKILTVESEDIAERASLRNKAQEVAKRNNLPFSDKFSMGFEDDFDTAVYDGSMSADDYEKLQQADIEPKADRPTITCDWSEHPAFEDGKTYSVADFDRIMKSADDEWVEQRQLEIEEYGSENAVAEAYRNGELDDVHLGYAKTKFIINMPNGTQYTERQDIGDGIGGVIDFLKQYPQYSGVVKVLEADIEFDKNDEKSVGLVETKEIYNATETKGIDVENTETQYFAEINNLQKGDVIYIDETEFAVETIGNFDIQLRDLSSSFPVFRAESKENLNRLLASKTAYFPAKTQDENEVTQNIETEQPTLFDFDNGDTLFSDAAHTTVEKGKNYVMEDRETVTGAKTKFKNNITAIRILKTLESENRKATVAEQRQLSLYTGWGGLANAFEPDNDKWKNEYLELKNLLTDDEYTAARSSVLDAFYTDSTIIDSIYKVIQNAGLESGNILEPAMGIGNFFGRLPADLRGKVNLYGVEKDSLSGRIAQKLYPQANITIDGFENTHFNDNSFDVAIGNIPFGDFGVNDKKYNSQNLKIHDYFFLKSLDKVRDGGIIAFLTSKGTLDKKDSSFRRELANRADLVGAIRLPNNAFKSAGTEVTSDIIFLKKRSEPPIVEPTWVSIGQTADGLPVNNYFVKHPEMVLGEIVEGNKMYGRTDDTMCVPFDDGRTLSDLLAIAVNNISFTYTPHKDKLIPLAEKSDEIILPQGIRAESYFKSNNDIYFYGSNNESELITIISNKSIDKSVTVTKTYGAHGYSGYAIFQSALNLTEPKVYKIKLDEFGRPIFDKNHKPISELDVPATQVVQQKANAIRREFKNWIFKDADRRKDILDTYNRTFNCIKPRQYDGSHLTFPGMNSNIELHEHQKNAIAHAIFGGNTLFAHSVGAGKTFEMIATAMECKRLGLCHKSLFAVPNHLTEQVGDDFLKLYPNANILVATKDDFKTENRKKLMSKIATGNYDAVIIGHTQLKMLPLSPERQQAIYQEQIDNIIKGIAELKAQDGSNFKIKDMERTKKSLEKQLTKLQSAKKDNSIYFEELGIDKLFIDEAHEFKNLFCTTKLQNVSGISSRASQRATELFAKCRYLDDKTGGKGVVFATGTPISNSVTELHTMMRYLNYDFLASHNNMQNFDNWVSTFGVQKKEYELAPAGNKFRERTRIAEYSNLPELMSMFKLIADVRTSDTLNLNVPKCEMHIVDVEPTELQEELVNELSDRADEVNNGSVDPSQDNMLKITGDGRKLGLDPRLIDAEFEDNPGTKLNVCVNNVFDIYEKTTDKKLTQIIFCDLGVPGKGVNVDADSKDEDTKSVTEIDSLEESGKFCVYDDIKDKLIAKGVSPQEIAFIHDAKNEKQKSELFAKVRSGEVRILLGSTGKMGTGTNVQDRIIALHDLDVPWRPSDLEQRRGRMVRQGNINEKVHLYRYVTKGTFDAYSYQLLEKKQKFISQIMTSKAPARKCTDVDQAALSYSEIKALCTGDERIREKLTLENRVKELTAYKSEYDNTHYELEDKVNAYPEQRKDLLCTIGNIQKDIDKLNALPKDDEGSIVYTYNFGDAAYTNSEEDRKSAAKALGAFVALSRQHRNETIKVGDISGYEVEIINKGLIVDDITARLGNGKYKVNFGSLNIHNLSKLENLFTKFNEFLSNAKKELNRIDYDYNSAKEMLTKPFEFEQELTEKTNRLAELTTALNIDLAQRQNVSSERKTCYFSKNSILHRTKNKIAPEQNKPEIKRSAPEL